MSDVPPTEPTVEEEVPSEPVSLEGYKALKDQEGEKTEEADTRPFTTVRDKVFHITTDLPAIIILDLGVASDPASSTGDKLRALRGFLNAAIVEDEVDGFNHLLRTAKPSILMDELNEITEDLMTKVVAVPTE
jgi:hypothetical protein